MLLAKIVNIGNNPVAFTFFIGCMAMFASSVFFFVERGSVDKKWKLSLLVSALITGIAAVHYLYMRDYFMATGENPTAYRYIDWILTVPLMCVEFYLLTKLAGATKTLLWKLIIASTWMLVAGYIGEAFSDGSTSHSVTWGMLSTVGYLYVLYTAWFGEVAQLAANSKSEVIEKGVRALAWFVLVGWAIYPIGYFLGYLAGGTDMGTLNIVYNLADVLNKIAFGLFIWYAANEDTSGS